MLYICPTKQSPCLCVGLDFILLKYALLTNTKLRIGSWNLPVQRSRGAKAPRTPLGKLPPCTRPPSHKAQSQIAARPTPGPWRSHHPPSQSQRSLTTGFRYLQGGRGKIFFKWYSKERKRETDSDILIWPPYMTSSLTFAFKHSYELRPHGHRHVGDEAGWHLLGMAQYVVTRPQEQIRQVAQEVDEAPRGGGHIGWSQTDIWEQQVEARMLNNGENWCEGWPIKDLCHRGRSLCSSTNSNIKTPVFVDQQRLRHKFLREENSFPENHISVTDRECRVLSRWSTKKDKWEMGGKGGSNLK